MRFEFWVVVEVEREAGKFASKDEIAEQIQEMLDGANEGNIDGVGADGESTYNIIEWEVTREGDQR